MREIHSFLPEVGVGNGFVQKKADGNARGHLRPQKVIHNYIRPSAGMALRSSCATLPRIS